MAGAWIGGNIDTTAAVTAAGTLAGEDALKIATIVKVTQNALIGIVAVALTAWFAFKVERTADAARPGAGSSCGSGSPSSCSASSPPPCSAPGSPTRSARRTTARPRRSSTNLRTWFLILAFVSIGLEFRVTALREAGWRPIAVFASATVVNIVLALALAALLFADFTV